MSEHASEGEPADDAETASGVDDMAADTSEADEERRQAAIDEAVSRLSRMGTLDEAARAVLIETLQRTQQEDWPVVVDAFASSLAESATAEAVVHEAELRVSSDVSDTVPEPHVVAKADLDDVPTVPPEPPAAEAIATAVATSPVAEDSMPSAEPAEMPAAPEPIAPPFEVRNACFASRVQAWGVLDRFSEARFQPGQEVIVYFELDHLSSTESAAGHTTCIDASLKLVDASGQTVEEWSFEPIAETCPAKRRDYFARYVIRIPETVTGPCRLDIAVVDTLADASANATLPLDLAMASR